MDILTYIDRGGIIVYILIFLNIIGFSIMFWKLFILVLSKSKKQSIIKNIIQNFDITDQSIISNQINIAIKELEVGLNTIKIIALISPLLGLLGTVVGVLNTFDSITNHGLQDPTIFSGGISVALITTVAGLIVAIPHYIGYNYFIGILDNTELDIEKEILASQTK
jgi:biopolymer transport protein ExbB